jgi:hypothetical protein
MASVPLEDDGSDRVADEREQFDGGQAVFFSACGEQDLSGRCQAIE